MAVAIRSCLGVDLGTHSIRVAHLEMGKAGPRVLALLEEPLKIEAGANLSEPQRHQAMARQVQEMLKKAKIRTRYAVFCIPGQSVFVKRPPKLPRTTPERLDRIIRFEARQQIPFPLDKTIMEYQVFEEGDPNEVSVLLAAIKRDYITNFMKMIKRTSLSPLAISVSSLALYNFHELNTSGRNLLGAPVKEKKANKPKTKGKAPEEGKAAAPAKEKKGLFGLGKKKTAPGAAEKAAATAVAEESEEEVPLEEMGFEEVRAYVNLGSSLMDLAIAKPGSARMIGFTRSVPLAGNEMDRAIREKLGLGSLEEARKIKETEAVILSTEFEIEGDSEAINMEASEAATAVADRIISELRRSLDYFISQPDGVAVDSIVLSGGLARLEYLGSYIQEKLGLPVELAEVKHAQLRLPDQAPTPFCPYVVATGLALQGLGLAQNSINFLPEEVKTMQAVRNKPFEMLGMAGMLAAIVGLSFNVGSVYSAKWRDEVNRMSENFQTYQKQNARIADAEGRNAKVGDAYTKLSKAAGWRDFWFQVLRSAVLERRPPDVVLDELQLRLDGVMVIKGRSPNFGSINKFLEDLGKVPYFIFNNGTKSAIGYFQPPISVSDPRFSQPVFDFGIAARTPIRRARLKTFGDQPGYTPPSRPGYGVPGMPGGGYPPPGGQMGQGPQAPVGPIR